MFIILNVCVEGHVCITCSLRVLFAGSRIGSLSSIHKQPSLLKNQPGFAFYSGPVTLTGPIAYKCKETTVL